MIDAMGREYAKKRPYRDDATLEAFVAQTRTNLERRGIKFRVDGEPYNPILPCEDCGRPTEHTFAREAPSTEDPNFKYQMYKCIHGYGERVWGCEGAGEGE